MKKKDIRNFTLHELRQEMERFSVPKYRANQIFDWLYKKGVCSFDAMSNLSPSVKALLAEYFSCHEISPSQRRLSSDGTEKILFLLADGNTIETVSIPVGRRNTLCVSTQVGCKFGCLFCASGMRGFVRNLETSEILAQILYFRFFLKRPLTNIVFMGIGEPLDNMPALLKAVAIINNKDALDFGKRKMTISTCGIIPGIQRLGELKMQIELSISLHAPDDELRNRLMPVNRTYGVQRLVAVAREYAGGTKRAVTFEYILIRDFNDSLECAEELAGLLKGGLFKVNLIPLSPVEGFCGETPDAKRIVDFNRRLKARGIAATVRSSRGADIDAACGQLRITHNT